VPVLTVLLVAGGVLVSLLLLDELFVKEGAPGTLFVKFLESIRLPLGLTVLAIALANAASPYWRDGSVAWNDYPFLTWIVVFINAFLTVREPVLRWVRLDQTAFAAFMVSADSKKRVFGLVGLAVCGLKLVMTVEPLLRFLF
jgi:hypothetical protein